MLDTSKDNLCQEITDAITFRKKHLAGTVRIIERYMGNWYRDDYRGPSTPDNLLFAYIATLMPDLCFSDPSARVGSNRPLTYKTICEFLEMGLNSWIARANYGDVHTEIVVDMALCGYGMSMVGLEPVQQTLVDEQWPGGALKPFVGRVAPDRVILDGRCDHWLDARYVGHEYFRDLDWIKKEGRGKGFDADAIDEIANQTDDWGSGSTWGRQERIKQAKTPMRNQVHLVDVWVREDNTIHTLSMAGREAQPVELRSFEYKGPATGPYQMYGAYLVPGDPYPISRLQAAFEAFEDLNAHARAATDAAKSYKRGYVVDAAAKELKTQIINMENGGVAAVPGLNPTQYLKLDIGGVNPEQLGWMQETQRRWNRNIGQGDSQRGTSGKGTATAEQITEANVDATVAWIKRMVYHADAMTLEKVMWYFNHEPSIVFDVYRNDPFTQQVFEGIFVGGVQPGQEDMDLSSFHVSILDESMSLTDNQVVQARALQLTQLTPQFVQMLLTMPIVNVQYLVNMLGESMNTKNLFGQLFKPEMIAAMKMQMAQQQAQQGQQPGPPGGAPPGLAGAGQQFNNGLGPPLLAGNALGAPGPMNPVFPTSKTGFAKPVNPRHNGPNVGPGASPLPANGRPKTRSVGL